MLQAKLRSLANVTILTSAETTEVECNGERVTGLVWRNRTTEELNPLPLEGIFVQIGLVPNTEWLKGTLALSRHGEIEVNARGETSVPGVFAAGDCTTVPYKQIVIAMGEGSKAGLSAFDYMIRTAIGHGRAPLAVYRAASISAANTPAPFGARWPDSAMLRRALTLRSAASMLS